jgi:hypothetical protein
MMTASPNRSHRIRDEVDEVYTFPIKHDHLGYDIENATVLVNRREDGTATVLLTDPPGRQGYYLNYSDPPEEPAREALHQLAEDLVERAETLLEEYDPQLSRWKANSGNRSLRDIYVQVDVDEIEDVILKMYQLLVEFKPRYLEHLEEYEPAEVVSPTNTLHEKVDDITGGVHPGTLQE